MNGFEVPEITIQEASEKLKEGKSSFVDIRDEDSFSAAHIPGAVHLNEERVHSWIAGQDKETPVVVYCYHGNSSLAGAAFLLNAGFKNVCSMQGGFEAWRGNFPHASLEG